ncbi:hypothetical protein ACFQJ7_01655 [Halovenus rubra]|uniref:Uncharacterized protein n=2 Tax=Halovenus rubra TaxID=869890 RepID=A0ACC7E3I9_9EURY|nr:hypothetical protein [Halovenus rubra]
MGLLFVGSLGEQILETYVTESVCNLLETLSKPEQTTGMEGYVEVALDCVTLAYRLNSLLDKLTDAQG